MISYPHCKINIGLNITEKRGDGYHNLESIFYPVMWTDILEIVENTEEEIKGNVLFSASGIPIDGNPESNLCYKAYQLLHSDYYLPSVKMHLHKNIPMGAGLGGGSSDAAYTLRMLNDLFGLGLREDALREYARKIGSDCAFFIQKDATYNWGKGDEYCELDLNLSNYYVVVVHPGIHVSTQEAYRGVIPGFPSDNLKELIKLPVQSWKGRVVNDFEKSIFPNHPEIEQLKEQMYAKGAVFASMSGSGSAVFGLFEKLPGLEFPESFTIWEGKL